MLAWPHSGFSAYVRPAIAAEDRAAVLRVARYGARAPVVESRLRYNAEGAEVELASDAVDGADCGRSRRGGSIVIENNVVAFGTKSRKRAAAVRAVCRYPARIAR